MDFSWLYKGRDINNPNVWHVGGLVILNGTDYYDSEECFITDFNGEKFQVDPYYIYKSTGLFNADGDLIWEGDYIQIDYLDFSPEDGNFLVAWDQNQARFIASNNNSLINFDKVFAAHSKVISESEDFV